ncbi:MAG: DNA polymerase III subunit beta [Thermoanaerobaculia bacterium]|nr:MAG: DNA polymerase III subunit beta [Thermoanaerobaculia bacterium]
MEIRLKRELLLAELVPMQGIVERRTTIPVLSHLLIAARDGRMHLAATDLDVSLTSSLEASVKGEWSLAVQARKFLEIVRALVADEITLTAEDEKALRIVGGRSRFRIHGLPPADFPTLPRVEGEPALALPLAAFRRMVGKVLFAVSSEESRFQLSGALLKLNGKRAEMIATDGHRLALIDVALPQAASKEEAVLVPRKALHELLRLEGEGSLEFRRGEHHLAFRCGAREMICRILEGAFPDYERVIARNHDKKVVCDRRALSDAVQRVALVTGERNRGVRLEFGAGEIAVAAANPDLGEASETLACEYGGPALKIGLNPDYLAQFLQAVETEQVLLELKDENSQCVGQPVRAEGADERYLCVIMPMRI